MLTTLIGAGLLARARAVVSGPIAGALAVALVAVVVAGSIGLGLWWLRGDAARDAGAAVQAQCDKAQLEADLAAATAKNAALEHAHADRSAAMANMQRQAQLDAEMIGELVRAKGEAEDAAKQADVAAGRHGVGFRADDEWLRRRRAAAGSGGSAAGR
jgi:hypothetical protein